MSSESGNRVAVVFHEPQLGGASLALLRAIEPLERLGWSFSFWVPGRGAAEQELCRRGHDVATAERLLRFSLKSLRQPPGPVRRLCGTPAYLRAWRAWLRSVAPDLIHANSLLALPEVATAPRGRTPLILHTHELVGADLKGRVAARLARRADVVVTVSQAARSALSERGVESTVIYEAVTDPGPRERRRAAAGLVVGTLGTVSKRKGSDIFLAAARSLQARGEGIEFRMVGDLVVGGERPWAERIAESARGSGIRLSSGVDPFVELADWDIFVLPSRMDPCPLAVLEAMAMGLPVVGSRVGGIPEQLGNDAGVLVEPDDPDAVAQAVLRLADSGQLRASLGEAARRRVGQLFTVERQADALDRLYRRVLGLRQGAGGPSPQLG